MGEASNSLLWLESSAGGRLLVVTAGGEAGCSQDTEVLVWYAQVLEYHVVYCDPTGVMQLGVDMT